MLGQRGTNANGSSARTLTRRGFIAAGLGMAGVFSFALLPSASYADTASDLADAAAKLESLGEELAAIQEQLETATSESATLEDAVQAKGEEVLKTQADLADRRSYLANDMSRYYKRGSSNLLDYVLSSSDFEELVARVYYADKVTQQQAEAIAAVKELEEQLTQEQEELQARQDDQEAKVTELQDLVTQFQGSVDEAASVYNSLDSQLQSELAAQKESNEKIAKAIKAAESPDSAVIEVIDNANKKAETPSTNNNGSSDSNNNTNNGSSDSNNGSNGDSNNGSNSGGNSDSNNSGGNSTGPTTPDTPINQGGSTGKLSDTSRSRDTYLSSVSWGSDSAYINYMATLASNYGSGSDYFCTFDNELCRVVVLQRSGSGWTAIKLYNCNGAKVTYGGLHTVTHKRICNWDDSYFGKGYNDWATCYIEAYVPTNQTGHYRYNAEKGAYECCAGFHSTGYSTTGWGNSGCCGLQWGDAKWIYDNIPLYTNVYEFCYSSLL